MPKVHQVDNFNKKIYCFLRLKLPYLWGFSEFVEDMNVKKEGKGLEMQEKST